MPTNSTSTTVTETVTHTSTQQLPASPFFLGIPNEIWFVLLPALVLVIFLVFRFQVKTIPVQILWIYKNASGLFLRAKQDLNGIFVDVLNARGKSITSLKATGIPIEVSIVPDKAKVYIIRETERNGGGLDPEIQKNLESKGFKVKPYGKETTKSRKAYLVESPAGVNEKVLAYIDVALGGLKRMRLYSSIEGTGETINWFDKVNDSKSVDPGNTAIIHEERNAAREYLRLLQEAAQGSWKTIFLPLICGIGIGGLVVVMIMLFSGHFR